MFDICDNAGNFRHASIALLTSFCSVSSADPNRPLIKKVLIVAILFSFITEFILKPDASKDAVPLVTRISQGDRIIGVFEDMYAIVVSFSISSS